jgi:hypothetical protein
MSDIEGLFAPIPTRIPTKIPLPIQTELNLVNATPDIKVDVVSSPKKLSFQWLPSFNVQFYIVIGLLSIGLLYLLWYSSKQQSKIPPKDETILQKIKTASTSAVIEQEMPTMADIDALPKLHINSLTQQPVVQPEAVTQPQPLPEPKFNGDISNPENLKELGKWMRDGLAARKVTPDVITHILTFTIRSILQKTDPVKVKPVPDVVVAPPALAPAPPPEPKKPIGGRIDIRGKPIPTFAETETETTSGGTKESKINAELDPRIIAMLKSRIKEQDVE